MHDQTSPLDPFVADPTAFRSSSVRKPQSWVSPRPASRLSHAASLCENTPGSLMTHPISRSELGRIINDLAPATLAEPGLLPALRELAEHWQRLSTMPVELVLPPSIRALPGQVATALYRIVQEALANAVCHAHAHTVRVAVMQPDDTLTVIIADDGCGGATARLNGVGLVRMRERASAIGATLRVISPPGLGTQIQVDLRLPTA